MLLIREQSRVHFVLLTGAWITRSGFPSKFKETIANIKRQVKPLVTGIDVI